MKDRILALYEEGVIVFDDNPAECEWVLCVLTDTHLNGRSCPSEEDDDDDDYYYLKFQMIGIPKRGDKNSDR